MWWEVNWLPTVQDRTWCIYEWMLELLIKWGAHLGTTPSSDHPLWQAAAMQCACDRDAPPRTLLASPPPTVSRGMSLIGTGSGAGDCARFVGTLGTMRTGEIFYCTSMHECEGRKRWCWLLPQSWWGEYKRSVLVSCKDDLFVSLVTTHKTQEERWNRIEFIAFARSVTVKLVQHTPNIVQ